MTLSLRRAGAPRWLKAQFYGFGKSGKTYTAARLAAGAYRFFGLTGPIVGYQSEPGLDFVGAELERESGAQVLIESSDSFQVLLELTREMSKLGSQLLIVDSVSLPWQTLCAARLRAINTAAQERARQRGWKTPRLRERLEFQDWGPIKDMWNEWVRWFIDAPVHVILCGRAGWEYSFEEEEEGGKKALRKQGTKLKAEGEFGYEASLLVEMHRTQTGLGEDHQIVQVATVLGDRADRLTGRRCERPTWEFFRPHLEFLQAGIENAPIDRGQDPSFHLDTGQALEERRQREILAEEVKGLLVLTYPGRSADEQRAKAEAMQSCFGTTSWTRLSTQIPSGELISGLVLLKRRLGIDDGSVLPEEAKEQAPAAPEDDVTW